MLKSTALATTLLAASVTFAAAPAYHALPLRPRPTPPADAKLFTVIPNEEANLTVPNVFNDPRMWGERFRELTLGAVETGIVVADFDNDGMPDIFAVSKNGPCALYRQVAPFKFLDVAIPAGVTCDEPGSSKTGATAVDINHGRLDGPLRLPLRRPQSSFHQRHQRRLRRKRRRIRPRRERRLRPRRLRRLRSRRRPRRLPRHQHPRFLQSPPRAAATSSSATTAANSPTSPPTPASGVSRKVTPPSGSTPTTTAGPISTSRTTSKPPTASTSTTATAPSPTSSTNASRTSPTSRWAPTTATSTTTA